MIARLPYRNSGFQVQRDPLSKTKMESDGGRPFMPTSILLHTDNHTQHTCTNFMDEHYAMDVKL